ncbi:hypothetical protein J3R30DRAFT_3836699 [Lentinula aciculospora]|uniref:DUF218 domain-containing protein n=1 Tax=Lentinula aciculospora TaxID=153920 RepID=A0A9W9DS01_9AGAR|nr:hypothetical protein J3R30DRAFT_3836699 [Lentinula aciculospora]
MLPLPVSHPQQRFFYDKVAIRDGRILSALRSRARITNLGLLLLFSLAFFSLMLNVNVWIDTTPGLPKSILSTLSGDTTAENIDHLIVVPGHAIWNGASAENRLNESLWTLEPYQRNSGRIQAFYQHIAHASKLSLQDKHSLVVFSGGQTRRETTTTEAESYMRLAMQANLLPHDFIRATTENYALDSHQNLLFSIARFHEYTGAYPVRITVVGYEMKRKRFADLHRVAVRWAEHRFEYIGIDSDDLQENDIAQEGEMKTYMETSNDMYHCHSQLLQKRKNRNHHRRYHPYHTSSPELSELIEWCPVEGSMLYNGMLPWIE